jgi:hypothetical protein
MAFSLRFHVSIPPLVETYDSWTVPQAAASTFEIKKVAHSMHRHPSRFPVLDITQRHHGANASAWLMYP